MSLDYLILGGFIVFGMLFVAATVTVSNILSPTAPSQAKGTAYECGSRPVGPPWVQFRVGYYVYALLFVVFDIETVFLYPWAVAFGKPAMGLFILVEMVIFVTILVLGLLYAWKEGALTWR